MTVLGPPWNQAPFVSPDPPANVFADPATGFIFAHPEQTVAGTASIFAGVGSSFSVPAGFPHVRATSHPAFDWDISTFSLWILGGSFASTQMSLWLCTGRDGWIESTNFIAQFGEGGGDDRRDDTFLNGITAVRSRSDSSTPDWGAAYLVVEAHAEAWGAAHASATLSMIANSITIDFF